MQSTVVVEALRVAAGPLSAVLPQAAWLPHRLVRLANGRLDKPPCEGAVSNRPETWVTLDKALELLISRPHVAGIGFAICAGIISLDYDHCRDPVTGVLHPVIEEELERFNSFAYITPSGTGIRIVGRNSAGIPGGKRVRVLPGSLPEHELRVEIFVGPTNHYNTLTGDVLPGYETLRDISDETLDYLSGLPERQAAPAVVTGDGRASDAAVAAALGVMANREQDWNEWSRVGMAAWRASGGSLAGLAAWMGWSAKHPCHDPDACQERWQHWFKSPPTQLGFGTLYYLARQERPLFVPPFGEVGEVGEGGDDTTGEGWDQNEKAADERPRADILHISEVVRLPPLQFLIGGLLPEGGLSVLYGPPKSGKTFVALSMGLHIAAGKDWAGLPVRQGGVVYIAGEGLGGLGTRLLAACAQYGIALERLPFWVVTHALDFTVKGTAEALVRLVRGVALDEPIAWVVIDTLARAMPGADENSAEEVGLVIAAADRVRFRLHCAVAALHHAGKDASRGMRGTSALRGAVDATLRVEPVGERMRQVRLVNEDQKDAELAAPMLFDMVEVTVPGSIGRSSLVPVLAEGATEAAAAEVRVPGGARTALDALTYVLGGPEGALLPPTEGLPRDTRGVPLEAWRREFYARRGELDPAARRQAFHRAIKTLTEMRLIGSREPWVWRVY